MVSWNESTSAGRGTVVSGPLLAAMAVAIGLAAAALSLGRVLPPAQFLPAMATVLLVAAACLALVASIDPGNRARSGPDYWDLSALLVFLGICAGVGSEPDHVLAFVGLEAPQN